MHPMLNIAVRTVRSAGNLIARNIGRDDAFDVREKGPGDYVTDIDRQCEEMIASALLKSFRTHSVLGEELGEVGSAGAEYQWVIDPLDGTQNFVQGISHVAVSVALRRQGKLEVGVVFNPFLNEMFTAARGEGAMLNGRHIRVSTRDNLQEAIIGTAFPVRHRGRMEAYLKIFGRLINSCADVRRMGAASLDLCYVAAGRLDGYLEQGLMPWDFAAGELILREAGGLITDFTAGEGYSRTGNLVCGNSAILRQLLRLIEPQDLPPELR
ncbi:MAG: inositol monophosphatase [Succinivibrionaceae bacterium]|nr:inositol monophosphatase [Succinivibrionaceae bacterium]